MKTGEVSIYQQYEDKIQSLERQLNAKTIGFDLAKRMIRGKNKELDYKDKKISELESEVARCKRWYLNGYRSRKLHYKTNPNGS